MMLAFLTPNLIAIGIIAFVFLGIPILVVVFGPKLTVIQGNRMADEVRKDRDRRERHASRKTSPEAKVGQVESQEKNRKQQTIRLKVPEE